MMFERSILRATCTVVFAVAATLPAGAAERSSRQASHPPAASASVATRPLLPDGQYLASFDAHRPLFVPSRNASGLLITVPPHGSFDSIRTSFILRAGKVAATIPGGIIYWKGAECIIAFGGVLTPEGTPIPLHGYLRVSALATATGVHETPAPGTTLFVQQSDQLRFPVVIDHSIVPPSDAQDDD